MHAVEEDRERRVENAVPGRRRRRAVEVPPVQPVGVAELLGQPRREVRDAERVRPLVLVVQAREEGRVRQRRAGEDPLRTVQLPRRFLREEDRAERVDGHDEARHAGFLELLDDRTSLLLRRGDVRVAVVRRDAVRRDDDPVLLLEVLDEELGALLVGEVLRLVVEETEHPLLALEVLRRVDARRSAYDRVAVLEPVHVLRAVDVSLRRCEERRPDVRRPLDVRLDRQRHRAHAHHLPRDELVHVRVVRRADRGERLHLCRDLDRVGLAGRVVRRLAARLDDHEAGPCVPTGCSGPGGTPPSRGPAPWSRRRSRSRRPR